MGRRSLVLVAASISAFTMVVSAAAAGPHQAQILEPTGSERWADKLEPAEALAVEAAGVEGKTAPLALGRGTQERTYLIRLRQPAVPSYAGGVAGLARTAPQAGEKLDAGSAQARAYRSHLVAEQAGFVEEVEDLVGRGVEVPFTYQHAVNGVAAVLTPQEAEQVAGLPQVASIELDRERELHTDAGPQWIGADAVWNAASELGLPADYRGEGIVIGTIDTGISPGNRSFAETGDDGYTHQNPLGDGVFLGACDPSNTAQFDPDFPCNNKLIGAYVFGGANGSALDYDGHGSHTASTSGGNVVHDAVVEAATVTTDPVDISGVAPHANVVSYLGCCTLAGLTQSIDQAIADGVDVINYSIGSGDPGAPWSDFDTTGFLNARAAGIFVATSNGNTGPGEATTGSPSSAPWVTSVGASTHDRQLSNAAIDLTSSAGDLPDISGRSVTGALPATPIVYAGDFGSPTCGSGTVDNPVNDWGPGTFDGQIVVCDRGAIGRVQKSVHVLDAGGGGIIHANDAASGDSLNGDAFAVPGVHIGFEDGQVLKDWLDNGGGDHTAAIRGTELAVDDGLGDFMAAFSSRGPNRAMDVIVPDVTAPGVDVLAALGAGSYTVDEHGFISGTSMSSPHVAGAGALLSQARPDWTPAQMQSALMSTGRDIANHDGQPATAYAQGAGHINVDQAIRAGLLFDESVTNYLAADPAAGGDPKTLNLPSMANTQCLAACSWDRTATVPDSALSGVTWAAATTSDEGLELAVSLSQPTVSPGDRLEITVTADVSGAPDGVTRFGQVTLTPDDPEVPAATLPVAVVPTPGVLPGQVDIDARRDAGSHLVTGIESIEVTDFTGTIGGFVPGTLRDSTLPPDPTHDDPYDDLDQVDVHLLDVPAGTSRLAAEMIEAQMPDADLFVGAGGVPSAATEACSSTSPASAESCDVLDPKAGTWWVLVQSWEGTTPDAADAYTLATAIVPSDGAGNGGVQGPSGPVPPQQPYDVRIHWDIPEMTAGQRWYGTALLGSSADAPGDIGSFPVTITRHADDVTKTADVAQAAPGQVVTYEITVEPNVTPADLEYTITDTLPDGLSYVAGSATGGATVEDGVLSWTGTMPTAAGLEGSYRMATNDTDPTCDTPFGGYLDLREAGIFPTPAVAGDTIAFTAFADGSPFSFYGNDYTGIGFTDDGFATFGVPDHYGGQPWVPQEVPDAAQPNNLIGALWHDFEVVYDEATGRGVSLALTDDGPTGLVIIDYRGVQRFGDDGGPTYTFQVVMQRQPSQDSWEIAVAYDELGPLGDPFTLAVENAAGDAGTALVNQESAEDTIAPGTVVCYAFEPPTLEPHTITYQATVDPGAEPGTYLNQAVHTTDDPHAQEATAEVGLEVAGEALTSITVEPDRFLVRNGKTERLAATGHRADGGTVDVTESVAWSTSDQNVLTVDAAGLATGVTGGTATVTATLGDLTGTAAARVTGRPADAGRPPAVTTGALPDVNVLARYQATLQARHGTEPYTWSATGLPEGLTLAPDTGVISNDPAHPAITEASTASVVVTVTDRVGRTAEAALDLDVTGVAQISTGGGHTCAVDEGGTAYCWGGNGNGQLGVGDTDDRRVPAPVETSSLDGPVAGISAGSSHTCAVTTAGSAYCWGFNGNGQLGTGDTNPRNAPAPVESGDMGPAVEIATGWQHTCAVDEAGAAYCWGSNFFGQLGNGGPPIERHAPWPVGAHQLGTVAHIAAYAGHTCAVDTGGAGFCWGYNGDGQLGDGTTENRRNPTPVDDSGIGAIARLSLSPYHTCAVSTSGEPYCWGLNASGQLGDGTTTRQPVPTAVITDELGTVREISAGEAHTCAVSTSDVAHCWGLNTHGQLGDGTDTTRHAPTAVVGEVGSIAAGGAHTCAVTGTGAAYCWGWNQDGQLGDGTRTNRVTPAPVHPGR